LSKVLNKFKDFKDFCPTLALFAPGKGMKRAIPREERGVAVIFPGGGAR
jgi:hypothetical protein